MFRALVPVLASLIATVGVLFSSHALAGTIRPDLEARLAASAPGTLIPVIVELEARANPHAAAAAHSQADRHARARSVIESLRDVSSRTQPPVLAALNEERGRGNARKVKSFWIFNGVAAEATEDVIRKIAKRHDVRHVRLDRNVPQPRLRPTAVSPSSVGVPIWNITQIRAPDVWALGPGYTGAGVVVGSFDTGVDGTHFELAPKYRGNDAISWFDPYGEHASPYDNNGHGTHTTGTIVGGDASGYSIGVAPGAQWIAAKAWNDAGEAFASQFHEIFEWFMAPGGDVANAPHVVNNSWGLSPPDCFNEFDADVNALRAAGIVAVFASGNDGPDPSTALSPGSYFDAFSVGSTDFFDDPSFFSGRGPSACDGGIKPDISAPGEGVLSTFPGGNYFEFDGTSMATPHVAGVAALMRSAKPTITVDEVESALVLGAFDLGDIGPDNDYGAGRLDAFESVRIALGLSVVGIVTSAPTAYEAGTTSAVFTVTRKGDISQEVTFTYGVGGNAQPGIDYVALPGTLTLAAGVASGTIVVTALDDSVVERDETVVVTLSPDPAYLLSPSQATVTIVSDEIPPDLVVSALTVPSAAGAGATIAVTDTTRNTGVTPALSSTTAFYMSATTAIDSASVFLAGRPVPALAPGASDTATTAVTIPAGTTGGFFWIVAVSDPGDTVIETHENNNTLARSIAVGSDLVLTGFTAPTDSGAGLPIVVTDTTRNQGAGAAGATTTAYYLSTNTSLDGGDVLLGSRAVPALGAGASDTGSATVTIPAATTTGVYYLIAKADGGDSVTEISEANNSVLQTLRVGPDLSLTAFGAPATAGAGATIALTDTTRNAGGAPASATTTRFYLSTNPVFDAGDTLLAGRAVGALAPGASDSGSTSATLPAELAAGTYFLFAVADADGALAETQEANNQMLRSIQVGADLSIWSFSVPTDAGAGFAITLTDTTRNAGASAAPASTTSYYLSTNTALDAGDVLLGSRSVPPIAAGAMNTGSVTVTVPASTATGTYYVFARADAGDIVSEISESNNVTYWQMRVGPDLTVPTFTAPASASAGASISVTDSTRNIGGGPAAATTTRFYLSVNSLVDAGDVVLASRAIPVLAANTSDTATTTVVIPAGTTPGTYYLIAKADADDTLTETTEGNNIIARALALGPDLVVTTLTTPSDTGAGLAFTVTDTTRNQGVSAAGPTSTAFYLSLDTTIDATDVVLGSRAVPSLAVNASSAGATVVTIPAGTTTGVYYLIARSDAGDALAEISETNNTMFQVLRVGPDLVVSSFTVPASTGPGATITVSDTTRNAGGAPAGATTTRFFLSTNNILDGSDALLASRVIPPLGAGASSVGSVAVTIPLSTAPGTYYLLADADNDGVLAESQEGNNRAAALITIGTDLAVTSLVAPTDVGAGLPIVVTDTTRNQGAGAAGATTTAYYLSTNTSLDGGDVLLGSRAVPALGAGASDTGSATVTIPAATTTGVYYLIAKADGGDSVTEISEANNSVLQTLRVGPDLSLTAFGAPATAGAGATIALTDTTRNAGGAPASATTTRFYLSTNPVFDAGDTLLAGRAVGALAPGASDSGSTSATLPAELAAGTYFLFAVADADGALAETQEANNQMLRSIQVGADLSIWSFSVPTDAGAGFAITLTDTTRNAGASAAPASTTSYYLSTNTALDAGDVLLGSRSVPPIAAGAMNTGSVTVTVPASTATGTYYVFARADAGDIVSEISESNNVTYWQMRVGPDLTVPTFTAPASASAGASISVTDSTRNIGGGPAAATTTRFYLSVNSLVDAGDVVLASRAIPVLAANTSDTATTTVVIPAGTTPGTYYLIAKADADDTLAETTEHNNVLVRTIQVSAP